MTMAESPQLMCSKACWNVANWRYTWESMPLTLPSICYLDFDVCLPLVPYDYKHQLPGCICCKTQQTYHCPLAILPTKISVASIKLRPSRPFCVICGHWPPHDDPPFHEPPSCNFPCGCPKGDTKYRIRWGTPYAYPLKCFPPAVSYTHSNPHSFL